MLLTETPKFYQPRDKKAKMSIWADLSVSDMDVLADLSTSEQLKAELARIFMIEEYRDNFKNGILVDLYYYAIQFTRDQQFSREQASAFFSILKQTHELAIETPFGNVEHTFRYFRELVLCHAVKRPPYSIDLYSPEQVKRITEYIINTYFRHFKMYKYVFTPMVRLDLSMTYIGMPETPPPSESGDMITESELTVAEEGEEPEVKTVKPDEHPAAVELRNLIKQHLATELNTLRTDVEHQIKESEDTLNSRLGEVETSGGRGSAAKSAKGKKK